MTVAGGLFGGYLAYRARRFYARDGQGLGGARCGAFRWAVCADKIIRQNGEWQLELNETRRPKN